MFVFGFLALEKPNIAFLFEKLICTKAAAKIFFKRAHTSSSKAFYKFFKSKRLSTAGRNKPALA